MGASPSRNSWSDRSVVVMRSLSADAATPYSSAGVAAPICVEAHTQCGSGGQFNGVPSSAAQHCCGKGCRHCRIYWGLRKL